MEADSDAARGSRPGARTGTLGLGGLPRRLPGDGRRRPLVPADRDDLALLLDTSLLEKAIYELAYELNNRPDWVAIPLRGIRDLLDAGA